MMIEMMMMMMLIVMIEINFHYKTLGHFKEAKYECKIMLFWVPKKIPYFDSFSL